jgi:hypothetical protein
MKLTDQQREKLWHIMKGANCTDEWLMHYGEYLCENIAALIGPPPPTKEVVRYESAPYSNGSRPLGFDTMSYVAGLLIGESM